MSRIYDLLRQADLGGKNSPLEGLPADTALIQPSSRIEVHSNPRGPCADRFRLLRLRLQERWSPEKLKTLLVTSPVAHDGKSTVALNLATSLAEHGNRPVLLIGADLHHATLSERLGLPDRPGLAECLEQGLKPLSIIRKILPLGWYLLPAGKPRLNPAELLQTEAMADMLKGLSPHFDWLLIDSPPVTPLADTLALRRWCDASLLVVRAGYTPKQAVEQAVSLIGPKHVLGIILNGAEGLHHAYAKYYGAYGTQDSPRTNGKLLDLSPPDPALSKPPETQSD